MTLAPDRATHAAATGSGVGSDRARVDGPLKVTGTATYAYEHDVERPAYVWPACSTIARGRVRSIDATDALAVPGVIRVLTHETAPRLRVKVDAELWILQNDTVHFRGQIVAGVLADSPEAAREGAEALRIDYETDTATVDFEPDSADAKRVRLVMARPGTETKGDVEQGLATAAVRVDGTYAHPTQFHAQMEPHAVIAMWHDVPGVDPRPTRLTLHDTNQGGAFIPTLLAPLLGLLPNQIEVISPYCGGGFGGKGFPHAQVVLAALAAKTLRGRPVKLALSRQQMFTLTGHRPRSVQRIRLGADADGRLTALEHVSIQANSRLKSSIDQSAFPSRVMYATPNRRTEHRSVPLDLPPGTFMRAPGDFTGAFALETAMDELAHAVGLDPIELRRRNEPEVDPESGKPWSSRHLLECMERGADLIGWSDRRAPGQRRDGEWQVGLGMAAGSFPMTHIVSLFARVTYEAGRYRVSLQAADLGTGAATILPQIAADALDVPVDLVDAEIGRTDLPLAILAGGSMGTYQWGSSIVAACRKFREKYGDSPPEGASVRAQGRMPRGGSKHSRHAFGATFAEVAVSRVTGASRVRRLVGVYDGGTIINPRTARSQMIGGLTMAVSAALFEESFIDPQLGGVANADLAGYHIAAHADVPRLDVEFVGGHDPWFGPTGAKGIGEISMVGTPAAIGNAIFNATGLRLRDLPFTPDKILLDA